MVTGTFCFEDEDGRQRTGYKQEQGIL